MKPTHRLKILNKATGEKSVVGAGWQNEDGSITVVLNDFVSIFQNKELVMTLFPVDVPPKRKMK